MPLLSVDIFEHTQVISLHLCTASCSIITATSRCFSIITLWSPALCFSAAGLLVDRKLAYGALSFVRAKWTKVKTPAAR